MASIHEHAKESPQLQKDSQGIEGHVFTTELIVQFCFVGLDAPKPCWGHMFDSSVFVRS